MHMTPKKDFILFKLRGSDLYMYKIQINQTEFIYSVKYVLY